MVVSLKDALTFRYDERLPTVMLNSFQHLIELWRVLYRQETLNQVQGDDGDRQGDSRERRSVK